MITSKTVKTRKPHKCWGCWYTWPAGTVMVVVSEFDIKTVNTGYWCPVCRRVMDLRNDYEGWDCGSVRSGDVEMWEKVAADFFVTVPRNGGSDA